MRMWWVGLAFIPGLLGCGAPSADCGNLPAVLAVSPAVATANHLSAAPGDQQHFQATSAAGAKAGCGTPQVIQLLTPAWTVADSVHVRISSAADATNGLATCLGPTSGATIVTAHVMSGSVAKTMTASLTCN